MHRTPVHIKSFCFDATGEDGAVLSHSISDFQDFAFVLLLFFWQSTNESNGSTNRIMSRNIFKFSVAFFFSKMKDF